MWGKSSPQGAAECSAENELETAVLRGWKRAARPGWQADPPIPRSRDRGTGLDARLLALYMFPTSMIATAPADLSSTKGMPREPKDPSALVTADANLPGTRRQATFPW